MIIKNGYNSKPTNISLRARTESESRTAEFNIEQTGLLIKLRGVKLEQVTKEQAKGAPEFTIVMDESNKLYRRTETTNEVASETLSYITLDELLQLRDEINAVIQELVK